MRASSPESRRDPAHRGRPPARWLFALGLLLLLFPRGSHADDSLPLGTWKAAAAPQLHDRLEREVERLIQGIGAIYRPVARQLLKRAFQPCAALQIWKEQGTVAIQCDGQQVARAAPDGQPVTYTGRDGRIHQLSIHQDGDGLVQHVQGNRGSRTTRFARSGELLLVDVTIQSPRLPESITYQMRYR